MLRRSAPRAGARQRCHRRANEGVPPHAVTHCGMHRSTGCVRFAGQMRVLWYVTANASVAALPTPARPFSLVGAARGPSNHFVQVVVLGIPRPLLSEISNAVRSEPP